MCDKQMDRDLLRILFITPYLPSPIRVRPFQLIRHLVMAGHRVTVAALGDNSPADGNALAALREICEAVHVVSNPRAAALMRAAAALPTPTPLWAAWCQSPEIARLVRRLAAGGAFDVAHIEHLRAAHLADSLSGLLPCAFDAVDCLTDLRRQMVARTARTDPRYWIAWEEWAKLTRYEPRVCQAFTQIAVTSAGDAAALAALGVRTPITVISNGVDTHYFRPPDDPPPKRFDLVFSGKMSYQANEDAALFLLSDLLPRLDALLPRAPSVTVCLAGSGPSGRLLRAAARWEGRVTVTGYVDDLRPFLAASRVAVCPLRIGVGIQNKALEAMAMGLPTVVSPLAGHALVGASKAGGLRIADGADALSHACADWLIHENAAKAAGESARRYVLEHHQWEAAAGLFVALYASVRRAAEPARRVP
ncbi:MAG: glycosyltransferase [Cytophagales bacterium]|nr:glycosyltransferase [Armatimonadota bacterium]